MLDEARPVVLHKLSEDESVPSTTAYATRPEHVRAVAEAHTIYWGIASSSVVRRVSEAIHGVRRSRPVSHGVA
jgi:hypothetical protein